MLQDPDLRKAFWMTTHASAALGMPRAGYQRFIVLALITVILAVSTGDRATLSVAGPGIAKDLSISAVKALFGILVELLHCAGPIGIYRRSDGC